MLSPTKDGRAPGEMTISVIECTPNTLGKLVEIDEFSMGVQVDTGRRIRCSHWYKTTGVGDFTRFYLNNGVERGSI